LRARQADPGGRRSRGGKRRCRSDPGGARRALSSPALALRATRSRGRAGCGRSIRMSRRNRPRAGPGRPAHAAQAREAIPGPARCTQVANFDALGLRLALPEEIWLARVVLSRFTGKEALYEVHSTQRGLKLHTI